MPVNVLNSTRIIQKTSQKTLLWYTNCTLLLQYFNHVIRIYNVNNDNKAITNF